MGKMIKQEGEGTRMAIRAARRAALEQVKRMPSKDAQRQEEKKVGMYPGHTLQHGSGCG